MAVEAIKGVRTLSELSAAHASIRRHCPLEAATAGRGAGVFRRGLAGTGRSEEVVTAPLYQEIGRLKIELEWLKKKL